MSSYLENLRKQRERDRETAPVQRSQGEFFTPEGGMKYLFAIPAPSLLSDLDDSTRNSPWIRVLQWNQKYGADKCDRLPRFKLLAATEANTCLDHPAVAQVIKSRKESVNLKFDALENLTGRVDDEYADLASEIGEKTVDTIVLQEYYLIGMYVVASCQRTGKLPEGEKLPAARNWKKVKWFAPSRHLDRILDLLNELPKDRKTGKERCPWDLDSMTFFVLDVEIKGEGKQARPEYRLDFHQDTLVYPYEMTDAEKAMVEQDQGEKGAINIFETIGYMAKDQDEILEVLRGKNSKTKKAPKDDPPPTSRRRRDEPEDEPRRSRRDEPETPPPEERRSRRSESEEQKEEPRRSRRAAEAEVVEEPPKEEPRRRRAEPEEPPKEERSSRRRAAESEAEKPQEPAGSTHEMGDDDGDEFDRLLNDREKRKRKD